MPTTTRYPPGTPVPLDLVDIRKTQRRVTALLQEARTPRDPNNIFNRRHIPHSFCYVCSRLDPEGRFMGNPYKYLFGRGYLHRCEHVPPTPNPTMLNDTRPNTGVLDDGKLFDTTILNKDNLPKTDRTRFKLSPAFDDNDLRDGEEGRFLPLVSENTFLTTNPTTTRNKRRKADGRLSLPSLENAGTNLISRDITGSSNGSGSRSYEDSRVSNRRSSYSIGDARSDRKGKIEEIQEIGRRKKKPKEAFSNPSGIGPWDDNEGTDSRVLKYKHRKKEDWVRYAGPSNPFEKQEDDFPVFDKTDSSSKELTFDFHRRGTFSVTPSSSRDSSASSGAFVISRIKSASWCECPDVDFSSLRCKECFMTGGHEKWCVSKTGICPKCGKPFRLKKQRQGDRLGRGQSTLSPSKSMVKSGTDLSTSSHKRDECSSRRKDGEQRVRFHGGGSFVKESKKSNGGILKDKPTTMKVSITNNADRFTDKSNPALPRVDPNIHRKAYMLALAESRIKKMKKDPFAIENSRSRLYFSYFPLYKYPKHRTHHDPMLGIRREEEPHKKVKIKKGMKHILGDIKLEDYYPTGKKFPVEQECIAEVIRHP